MSNDTGTLFVVATPIGNLDDLSPRAVRTLKKVDFIAAEDTRHSRKILVHYGIETVLKSYHEFSNKETGKNLITVLEKGKSIALISDAGTPLISDPGFSLVVAAHERRIRVVPIPGPSALISGLAVSGMPTDKFIFEGFLPTRSHARLNILNGLRDESRTIIFFEAPHRIDDFLNDAIKVFGPDRPATIAREMTKVFETVHKNNLENLLSFVIDNPEQRKGEFVVIVQGNSNSDNEITMHDEKLLELLLQEMPLKKAANIVAQHSGKSKNQLYKIGLKLREKI